MREIQVAENKTLKLTNVLARKIDASELGNLGVILTQMQNFIKSHSYAGWPCGSSASSLPPAPTRSRRSIL